MIKYPDYKNSILGIPNSILHSMGLEPERGTLMLLDRYLEGKDYENIVVILLDGMGKNIMDANLARRGLLSVASCRDTELDISAYDCGCHDIDTEWH